MKVLKHFYHRYQSGFTAEVIQKPFCVSQLMGIMVNFGSADPQTLSGSAHYLEHQLFDKKATDIGLAFSALGAYSNAFTEANKTFYYASNVGYTAPMLDLLFKLVGEPYFSNKNVEKELGIIMQERREYETDPMWLLDRQLFSDMFGSSVLGKDPIGDVSDLEKITPAKLEKIYETYYRAENMHFVIVGDFDQKQAKTIFRHVGSLQKKYLKSNYHQWIPSSLPVLPAKSRVQKANEALGRFVIGLRVPKFKNLLASADLGKILFEIMLESNLGESSDWYNQCCQDGLLANPLWEDVTLTRESDYVTISGISPFPQKVVDRVKSALSAPRFDFQEWMIQKRACVGDLLRLRDELLIVAINASCAALDKKSLFEEFQLLRTFDFKQYQIFIRHVLQKYVCYTVIQEPMSEARVSQ